MSLKAQKIPVKVDTERKTYQGVIYTTIGLDLYTWFRMEINECPDENKYFLELVTEDDETILIRYSSIISIQEIEEK